LHQAVIRKILVGIIASTKVRYGYTYCNGTAHKPAAGLSRRPRNFLVWNYVIQRFTAAHGKAYNWSNKENLFCFNSPCHKE